MGLLFSFQQTQLLEQIVSERPHANVEQTSDAPRSLRVIELPLATLLKCTTQLVVRGWEARRPSDWDVACVFITRNHSEKFWDLCRDDDVKEFTRGQEEEKLLLVMGSRSATFIARPVPTKAGMGYWNL